MNRCLILAKKGLGTTRPNPMVGCVIVHKDLIIGEGFTSPYGGSHAEVNAIQQVGQKNILKEATLYVSLEPCCHHGKTPPCTDLIIKSGIKNIVIGCRDPFDAVNGNGISHLEKAGCKVIVGVLEELCTQVNRRFFTFHQKRRPFIVLKWAESEDGFMDKIRTETTEIGPNWISNILSRQLVHKWRFEEQAILIGTNTAQIDNPQLNVRSWEGESPIKVVIDRELKISNNAKLFLGTEQVLIFTSQKMKSTKNVEYVFCDFDTSLPKQICDQLYDREIQSVLVEGGAKTLQGFIDVGLWDEARIISGVDSFDDGLKAPRLNGVLKKEVNIKDNKLKLLSNPND